MPIVTFLRHAQSRFNIGFNEIDPDITDDGKIQAAQVSGYCDLVIISNLARCKQTLEHAKLKYTEMIVSELCREHRGGSYM